MQILRRKILLGMAGCIGWPIASYSKGLCSGFDGLGNKNCSAGISSGDINHQFANHAPADQQLATQWCWAASVSMVFAFHGHGVDQETIVERIKGIKVNLPAQGEEISRALSRKWTDSDGDNFRSSCKVYDVQGGRFDLFDNRQIIEELKKNRPLVYGARGHAMVLTAVSYLENAYGAVDVRGGTVRDPWPGSGGRRQLTFPEMRPIYVAAVRIRELE